MKFNFGLLVVFLCVFSVFSLDLTDCDSLQGMISTLQTVSLPDLRAAESQYNCPLYGVPLLSVNVEDVSATSYDAISRQHRELNEVLCQTYTTYALEVLNERKCHRPSCQDILDTLDVKCVVSEHRAAAAAATAPALAAARADYLHLAILVSFAMTAVTLWVSSCSGMLWNVLFRSIIPLNSLIVPALCFSVFMGLSGSDIMTARFVFSVLDGMSSVFELGVVQAIGALLGNLGGVFSAIRTGIAYLARAMGPFGYVVYLIVGVVIIYALLKVRIMAKNAISSVRHFLPASIASAETEAPAPAPVAPAAAPAPAPAAPAPAKQTPAKAGKPGMLRRMVAKKSGKDKKHLEAAQQEVERAGTEEEQAAVAVEAEAKNEDATIDPAADTTKSTQ